MKDERAEPPVLHPGRSILIYGAAESALSVLAAGLAEDEVGSFGWADCATADRSAPGDGRRLLELTAESVSDGPVRPEELAPPTNPPTRLADWLVRDPVGAEATARLAAYLRLPSLLQRAVARITTRNARAVFVLTNADALPDDALERALGSAEVHATLRREGVTLIVTYRRTPSAILHAPFDQIYRVDSGTPPDWRSALVVTERGPREPDRRLGEIFGTRYSEPEPNGATRDPGPSVPRHRFR
jgi:hypothetical protein